MALTLPADAGEPMSKVLVASAEVKQYEFSALTRQVSLRNTGTNTLWLSLDEGRSWFDVACGTSWDDRVSVRSLWYCTQLGRTRFVVIGLALMGTDTPEHERTTEHEHTTTVEPPTKQSRRWVPSRTSRDRR